mmetsp:Transcript_24234/g.54163  ORF Transcript_24234/g.54163 Transcript_24234/m.54163 type:complete len:286 (+) Transcript_24234:294-1151(+)
MADHRAPTIADPPATRGKRRRRSLVSPPGLLGVCVVLAALRATACDGFSATPYGSGAAHPRPTPPPPDVRAAGSPPPRRPRELVRLRSTVADAPPAGGRPGRRGGLSGFQRRMRGLVSRGGGAGVRPADNGSGEDARPANMRTAHTLEEYRDALAESDGLVVTKFHATWCKSCRAIRPSFRRLASLYPHVTFLDVPVTGGNANLHQGLGVPSLPYGHVYHPRAGLVEELKISRRRFPDLARLVRWYDRGSCGLDERAPDEGEGGGAADAGAGEILVMPSFSLKNL